MCIDDQHVQRENIRVFVVVVCGSDDSQVRVQCSGMHHNGLCSVVSAVYWLVTSIGDRTGRNLISDYIDRTDPHTDGMSSKERERQIVIFMAESLKSDGIFLLRLIASNAGELVVCELVNNLWDRYKERRLSHQPPPPRQTLMAGSPGFTSQDTLRAKDGYNGHGFPPAYDLPDEHS
jgi:hypothetical protein